MIYFGLEKSPLTEFNVLNYTGWRWFYGEKRFFMKYDLVSCKIIRHSVCSCREIFGSIDVSTGAFIDPEN